MSEPRTKKEAKKFIKDLGDQIKRDIVASGKHYLVIANDIPIIRLNLDDVKAFAPMVRDKILESGHPATDTDKILVKDLLSGESKTLTDYL